METARNHEMDHKPNVAFQAERDTLADASNITNDAPLDGGDRRRRSQQRDARDPNPFQFLADDARF